MAIFDTEADNYDQWYETPLGNFVDRLERRAIFSLLNATKGESIIDVGCGTGNYSLELAALGCNVTGVDNSKKMIDIAIEKARYRNLKVNFLFADVTKLPFEDDLFDAAVCVAAVEFFDNWQKGVNEIFRVVKPGGKIVIGFINKNSNWGELYQSNYFKENTVFKYARLLGIDEIRSIHTGELIDIKETLYTPPDENEPSLEKEKIYSNKNKPGFIAALWKKKL
ncbi:class I SAM-dependent methyltransferase [Melioribacter sp. OK-6-Me]|uniref:class I SAM-dependent methyltransferase n=1 Tax=unclassified Melioribacter TaxID=2627329 RepID=UPI003ED96DC6